MVEPYRDQNKNVDCFFFKENFIWEKGELDF